MTQSTFDVCAIGNALVDVIANATDDFLRANKIAKGAMTLIDAERAGTLYDMIGPTVQVSGGSAANTIAGIASLGGHTAYMGKVKADQLGAIFRHDMHAMGVHFATSPTAERRQEIRPVSTDRRGGAPTGRCLILVTPDAQRSMSTYLGAAVEFGPDDIQPEIIKNSKITYLEGYLFDRSEAKAAFRQAAQVAHEANKRLALTLSDVFCVERHRPAFFDLIKSDVDILFANQNELMALYQTQDLEQAIMAVRQICDVAVTTRSEKGAVDLFAAGFLFGITQGKSLDEAGRFGSLAAAEVISHFGPRPQRKLKELI
jgi:sugar/nucleoside kinase (ribokinase family)